MADYGLVGLNKAAPDLCVPTSSDNGILPGGLKINSDREVSGNAENVADLRTKIGRSGEVIYLKAHTTAGDGGNGEFRWVYGAAPGTYVDNNGTIIVPTGGDGSAAWVKEVSNFEIATSVNFAAIASKQNWYDQLSRIRTPFDDRVIVQKSGTNRFLVYMNHVGNFFQRWELTRGPDGFDNSVPTHPNGNMFMINVIDHIALGETTTVLGKDTTRSGTTEIFGDVVTLISAGAYCETAVTGGAIFVRLVLRNDSGICDVSVDGAVVATIDNYHTSSGGVATTMLVISGLSEASHTVRVTATGTNNPASSGTRVRVEYIEGMGATNYSDLSLNRVRDVALPTGTKQFRSGQSAVEIAIYNRSTIGSGAYVWSGAYHKYCYPAAPDNQVIYLDGVLKDFDELVDGVRYLCRSFTLSQALILSNPTEDIATINMQHRFGGGELRVSWSLEWTKQVQIDRSYQAMYGYGGANISHVLFGDTQSPYQVVGDNSTSKHKTGTHNFVAWGSADFVVGIKSLNEYGMRYLGAADRMYMWDRAGTGVKVYMQKFKGITEIGDKWISDFVVSIGHCPQPDTAIVYDDL